MGGNDRMNVDESRGFASGRNDTIGVERLSGRKRMYPTLIYELANF